MSEQKAFLERIHIKNFLSLRNVTLPFKPLTVLVGPNGSGKTNIFRALYFLNRLIIRENLPSLKFIQNRFCTYGSNQMTFQICAELGNVQNVYDLTFKTNADKLLIDEELLVSDTKVISIQNGIGKVLDEKGKDITTNTTKELVLRTSSVVKNGVSGIDLSEFIKTWQFYDFRPGRMRDRPEGLDMAELETSVDEDEAFGTLSFSTNQQAEMLNMFFHGTLRNYLSSWYINDRERFEKVNHALDLSINVKIGCDKIDGKYKLYLLDRHDNAVPLEGASEGTLRLVAYYILRHRPELQPLITIEEPERNLHPRALKDIAEILQQLSERTQVIITTHSSQLLDAFDPNNLSDSLGVLLLRNRSGFGTEVLNLEEIREKREALNGWIADFGIGSAIFDSELLQDLMEEPT